MDSRKLFQLLINITLNTFSYYPSGDICQRLPSGEIRFVGRKDNQVKIRGFRIELDEIESCILAYPSLNAAKVMLNKKGEDIVAYYSAKTEFKTKKLKDFLKQKLPHYMIPRFLVYLESFPLTSNSKVDIKKLAEYKSQPKSKAPESEAMDLEMSVKRIWQKVLNLENLEFDADDSFFYLGGNSLTAQRLITELKKELKITVNMEQFYSNPTLKFVLKSADTIPHAPSITNSDTPDHLFEKAPLSFQQEQMLYLEQIDPQSSYNLAFIQGFDKTLNIQKLKTAFLKLLEENSIFRTIFKESDDDLEFYQEVLPMEKCFINVEIESFNGTESEKAALIKFKRQKFDLFNEIPVRVKLLETSDRFVILLIVHHAASDATTTMLMEREMSRIYQGRENNSRASKSTYQEFSIQQKSAKFKEKIGKLSDEYLLKYGSAYRNPSASFLSLFNVKHFTQQCKSFKFRLPSSPSQFTPFTLITAAVARAFLPFFPSDSFLLLGCPFANRKPETSETFGNFLNNLLLPLTSKHAVASLQELQNELLQLTKFGEIPFQCLCKNLRQKSNANPVDIQIYLNCRYDLENETTLNFDEIKNLEKNPSILTEIFEEVTNYPIEIDFDQFESPLKFCEITVRISRSLIEAYETKVKEICATFESEANKLFGGETTSDVERNNRRVLGIFNKFLQSDLREDDLQKSFIDLGGDSIMAMKLRRAVMKETGVDLDLKRLMTVPSLHQILVPKMKQKESVIEFFKNPRSTRGAVLVLVYPLVGGCLIYSSLIKELKKQALIRADLQRIIGLHPPSQLPETLEELASHHKTQLSQSFHNEKFSKIIFIGASFGAALGYQLCHELCTRLPGPEVQLISIDGTLQTTLDSLPSFKVHQQQITDTVASLASDMETDNFNLENEINSSWTLLQMAARYTPNPSLKKFKGVLLHTGENANLEAIWKHYVSEATVHKINGSHEAMLNSKNSPAIAELIQRIIC